MGHKMHYSSNVYKQITQNIDNFYNLWKPLEGALSIDFEIRDKGNKEHCEIYEQISFNVR